VVMVDFDGARTVGVSPGARVTNAVELGR
jgi:hypothetical protein